MSICFTQETRTCHCGATFIVSPEKRNTKRKYCDACGTDSAKGKLRNKGAVQENDFVFEPNPCPHCNRLPTKKNMFSYWTGHRCVRWWKCVCFPTESILRDKAVIRKRK